MARETASTPATLRRWVDRGLIPRHAGEWAPAAIAHAQLVARMRERGDQISASDVRLKGFSEVTELFAARGR